MNNQQYIKWLINKETDLVSSQNLAQLEIIHLLAGHQNKLQSLLFEANEFKIDNPEVPFFVGIVIADDATVENIDISIEAFDNFEIILFNNPSLNSISKTLKKYAPIAKISIITNCLEK